jgi:hypothetical protein
VRVESTGIQATAEVDEDPRTAVFPFDVLYLSDFPGEVGELMEAVRPIACNPPFPWGQWTYAEVFRRRLAALPGDVLEAGVGRGGMSLFLALLLRELQVDKQVIAVDSFEGLPEPDVRHDNAYFEEHDYSRSKGAEESVRDLWLRAAGLGVLQHVEFVRGFFAESLETIDPERRFCFVHIDADLFDSVHAVLDHLYDRVVDGGVIAIDDFFHPAQGPLRAASAFFNEHGVAPVYHVVLPYSVFVVKGGSEDDLDGARAVDGNHYSLDYLRRDSHLASLLRDSRERSQADARARAACDLFVDLLGREPGNRDIYDYWRCLEAYWESIDPPPPVGRRLLVQAFS